MEVVIATIFTTQRERTSVAPGSSLWPQQLVTSVSPSPQEPLIHYYSPSQFTSSKDPVY